MSFSVLAALVQSTAIVSLASTLIALIGDRLDPKRLVGQMLIGVIFALTGLFTMTYPVAADRFYFDGRNVVVALAWPLGGLIAGALTTAAVVGMRIAEGGPGMIAGTAGILIAAMLSLFLGRYWNVRNVPFTKRRLWILSALQGLVPILAATFISDPGAYAEMMKGPIPLTAATNVLGVAFCGFIVVLRRERQTMAAELERARQTAEAANDAKSAFLGRMSHELRSPLFSIIAGLEFMSREKHGPLGDRRYRDYVETMRLSALHLKDLVNDILDLKSIEAGKVVIQKESVSIRKLLDDVMAIMKPRAAAAGIELESTGLSPAVVQVDPTRMRQVLINLVTNAIRFTPAHGRITIGATTGPAGDCQITVRDTGVGIAAEDLDRVLKPFEQVSNEINRAGGGTGLGLPLAKELIELHNGTMTINSKAGAGTTVTLELPRPTVT